MAKLQKEKKFVWFAGFTTGNIATMAVLTAISVILYMFVKFPLPFIFPGFLDIHFSELPALLGGFSLGPIAGVIIVIIKCLIKMPFTGTACVGELADILIGVSFVFVANCIYQLLKSKKGAIISLIVGLVVAVLVAIITNRFMLIPFFADAYGMDAIIGMVASLYEGVTVENFYDYYIPLATIPFNGLRLMLCGVITYFVYKPLSRVLRWEKKPTEAEMPKEDKI